jgi:hypothetical protein
MTPYLARLANKLGSALGTSRWGKPTTAFRPGGKGALVLSSGDNASIAYLVQPHLERLGIPFTLVHLEGRGKKTAVEVACEIVIVARYLPQQWIGTLQAFRDAGGKIVYFMDDDLMDPAATAGLPKTYRRKVDAWATRQRGAIETLCDEFWVASPHLAAKYAVWSPVLLSSLPSAVTLTQCDLVAVCYHGSASHNAEIKWLAGLMHQVQSRQGRTTFEIFGNHDVNKLFRSLRRTSVLHPMDWLHYLDYTGSVRRDIGLAPLLPDPFNAGRSPSKFFDFARMGAVGIYTDAEPYRSFVRHGIDGLLLPNELAAWVGAIEELVADPVRRQRLAAAARERALAMAGICCEQH